MKAAFKNPKKIFVYLLPIVIVAVICTAFVFIRTTFVQPAAGKTSGYYVSDVYDGPIINFTHGETVRQGFKASGDIYGVRVRFHNQAIPQAGSVLVELVDSETMEVLASATHNTETLVNDNYSALHFDSPYLCSETKHYVLQLTPTFENPNAYMRIWADSTNNHIALGVIDRVADAAVLNSWFKLLWVLTIAVALVVYIVCFILPVKKETAFVCALVAVSVLFTMVLPPFSSPDEEAHFLSAYRLSNKIEGYDELHEYSVMRRNGDFAPIYEDHYTTVFSYEHIYENFFSTCHDSNVQETRDNWVVVDFAGVYTSGAVGLLLGKALNLGFVPLTYLGRLFNLLFFALCAYFAVKITPVGKEIFMALSFLPITLHLANSFSRDVFVISLGFLFTAYLLKLLYQQENYRWYQLALIMAISLLLAPSKYIYSLMVPLILLLGHKGFTLPEKLKSKRKAVLIGLSACALAVIALFYIRFSGSILGYIKNSLSSSESLETLLATSPDTTFTLGLLLQNPVVALRLFITTIFENGAYYLKSIAGGVLSYNSIYISDAFIFMLLFMVILSTCCMPQEQQLKTSHRVLFGLDFLLVAAAVVYACVTWTPVCYTTLYGLQGKYLMPALPLLLLACKNKVFTVTRDIFKPMCFAFIFTDIFVVLNALVVILQR